MAPDLERSVSNVSENMTTLKRSSSAVKLDQSTTPILQRTSSMLKASTPSSDSKLKALPSMSTKEVILHTSSPIRNRNIVIGVLSTLLVLAVSWHSFSPDYVPADSYPPITASTRWSHGARALLYSHMLKKNSLGQSKFLVTGNGIDMVYHKGPILVGGRSAVLKVHLIYYGVFSVAQKAIVTDFIRSFYGPKAFKGHPTVAGWWAIMKGYKNTKNVMVAPNVRLGCVYEDAKYSLSKSLTETDIENLVLTSLTKGLPTDPESIYLVLTASDVAVQGFCSSQCGTHSYIFPSKKTQMKNLPFAWVGNSAKQCAGYCAWPYAKAPPGAGPDTPALKSPNNDVGLDGMIINIAGMISGTATDPFQNGYYQGVAGDALEAAYVCPATYGDGAYAGYPGQLLTDKNGASFNVYGINGRKYLIPEIYNPATQGCALQL